MKVLFCSTATNALGETYSIAVFALELMRKGHECFFLAPTLGKRYLLTFGFEESSILVLPGSMKEDLSLLKSNKTIFNKFLSYLKLDFVIVADWHEFKPNGNSNNNSYSIHWFDKKLRFGTFDHCGFAPDGEKVEIFINGYKNIKHIPSIYQSYSFVIRPCPPHSNSKDRSDDIYYWSINYKKGSKEKIIRNELKKKVANSTNRLMFNPIGLWQERAVERIFKRLDIQCDYYSDIFLPIVFKYLSDINEPFTYVIVSGNIKKEVKTEFKNISIIMKPPLGNDQFTEHLQASDFVITDNLMSSSIAKSIFYNAIPIVFISSLTSDFDKSPVCDFILTDFMKEKINVLVDNNILFPFVSFPMGLNEILKMYDNNSYSSCFIKTEMYDENSSAALFNKLLLGTQLKDEIINSQNEYLRKNQFLPDAEEILLQIIENE